MTHHILETSIYCVLTYPLLSLLPPRWSHVGDKPFGCTSCHLTFTSKSQFAVHLRTHHTVGANHVCNVCGRSFVRDSYLIRHQNKVPTLPTTLMLTLKEAQLFIAQLFQWLTYSLLMIMQEITCTREKQAIKKVDLTKYILTNPRS